MSNDDSSHQRLSASGQICSYGELAQLVDEFEQVLLRHNIPIQPGSELEAACCSVLEVLGKNQNVAIRKPGEDVRVVFTEVLGIWTFLKKIVRLQKHAGFAQFVPHLNLLNHGWSLSGWKNTSPKSLPNSKMIAARLEISTNDFTII